MRILKHRLLNALPKFTWVWGSRTEITLHLCKAQCLYPLCCPVSKREATFGEGNDRSKVRASVKGWAGFRTIGAENAWNWGAARWKWGPTSRWGLDKVTVAASLRTWHCEVWGATEGVWAGGNVDLEDINWIKWRIDLREVNKRHRGGYSNSLILIVNTRGH